MQRRKQNKTKYSNNQYSIQKEELERLSWQKMQMSDTDVQHKSYSSRPLNIKLSDVLMLQVCKGVTLKVNGHDPLGKNTWDLYKNHTVKKQKGINRISLATIGKHIRCTPAVFLHNLQ